MEIVYIAVAHWAFIKKGFG